MSNIFLDREKLSPHYLPQNLLHRDEQIRLLNSFYKDTLDHIDDVFLRVCQIVGGVGTGKTCTVRKFCLHLQEEAAKRKKDLQFVYINCKVDGTRRFVLYGNIVRKITPQIQTESLSPEEMFRQLVSYLEKEKKYVILAFDEIDYFLKISKEHIISDLTRLPELRLGEPIPIIGEIFISRDLSHYERLENSELSTLGKGIIEFPKYRSEEIKDILSTRVEEAFKPGVVSEEIFDLISHYVARPPVNGDIRVALDLLLYSGFLAENNGYDHLSPDHVRKVMGETNPSITTEDILDLDLHGRLTLLSLARSLRTQKASYVKFGDILKNYQVVCEEYEVKARDNVDEFVQDLVYRGIVDMESLTKLGISGGSAEDVEKFLEKTMK